MQPFVRRWSRAVVGGVLAAACAHPHLATAGFNVSSERSDYSPAVRLAVALPVATPASSSDTLTVVIDSAVITAPGAVSTDTTPVMRDLYITPLLATRASPASATRRTSEQREVLTARRSKGREVPNGARFRTALSSKRREVPDGGECETAS